MLAAIFEGLGQHFRRTVDGEDVKPGFHELDGMEASAGSDVEHTLLAARFEYVDEEAAFAFRPLISVDQFVPFSTNPRTYSPT